MKLKKKVKIIIAIIVLIIIAVVGVVIYKNLNTTPSEVKEVEILNTIPEYGYNLTDNKTDKYEKLFRELEDILTAKEVDEEQYANKISEMFIYDFYSLEDKSTKTDVGGVEFVHPDAVENFLLNAEDTYYKYVESNIYNEREQSLPVVDEISIKSTEQTSYIYNNQEYEAYRIGASWTYTSEEFSSYQHSAVLYFIKDDIKLYLVELK